MLNIKKILLPVDLPNTSLRVVHQAAKLAHHFHSEIVILHVVTAESHAAGVPEDGPEFAAWDVLAEISDKPVCFEVLADDPGEMERQALEIAGWADNVYVKVPVTNTQRHSCCELIRRLADRRIKLNVTAVMTLEQVHRVAQELEPESPSIVSVFAGRIADTGVDPIPVMKKALKILSALPRAELLWASPREVLNIAQAEACGCHIITATPDVLAKLPLFGKDLHQYSLETVKMFHDDARAAGFKIV